jgi:hypothetical protein
MAGLLCGVGMAQFLDKISVPTIGLLTFTAIDHGQLWTCHHGATWSASLGTPWHFSAVISLVLTMMSKIATDNKWISTTLV